MSTLIKENGVWKTVANLSQSDVIRNPDWSKAVAITAAQLTDGYTAPADGLIVGYYISNEASNVIVGLRVNTELVAAARGITSSAASDGNVQVQVNKGDTISLDGSTGSMSLKFIPYKVSSASDLVMGASTTRKGSLYNITIENGAWKQVQVTFDKPMPDDNYCVTLTQNGSAGTIAQVEQSSFNKYGFRINLCNNEPNGAPATVNITWTAFKLFTVEGLEDVENDVAALKSSESGRATLTNIGITADNIFVDYAKVGRLVTLIVFVSNITSGQPAALTYDALNIGTLPAKLKPAIDCRIDCHCQANETPYVAEVAANGQIRVWQWGQPTAIENGANVTFTMTYITAN